MSLTFKLTFMIGVKVNERLTYVVVLVEVGDSVLHLVQIEVRFDVGDLDVRLIRFELISFYRVGILDHLYILLPEPITVKLLQTHNTSCRTQNSLGCLLIEHIYTIVSIYWSKYMKKGIPYRCCFF